MKSGLSKPMLWAGLSATVCSVNEAAEERMELAWKRELQAPVFASPVLADVDKDGMPEIAISSLDGSVYLMDRHGEVLSGWPRKTAVFQRVSPTMADLDGDGIVEVIVGDDEGLLHAWDLDGVYVSGFPLQLDGSIKSVARVRDVVGDEKPEILVHTGSSRLYLLDATGENIEGWPVELGGENDRFGAWTIASTPNWVDLDGDETPEVVVGTTRKDVQAFRVDGTPVGDWSARTEDWVYPSIVRADLDADGELELISGAGDGKLYVWDAKGEIVEGFPAEIGSPVASTVAVADLDEDGSLEIVAYDLNGGVHCFDSNGEMLAGWPNQLGAGSVGSPLILDVDGDAALDVLVPSRDNSLHVWSADGTVIAAPLLVAEDWIESTPLAADIDGDSLTELVYASHDGHVYCVELASASSQETLAWSGFLGETEFKDPFVPGDTDRDGLLDTYEFDNFGNLAEEAIGDFDGDGCSNYDEWVAGTSPVQVKDSLKVRVVSRLTKEGAQIGLSWIGKAERGYRILARSSLDGKAEEWYTVSGDELIKSGSGDMLTWFDVRSTAMERCFYRIQVERL